MDIREWYSLLWAVEPSCMDVSRIPAPDEPGPHFAMGDYVETSDRKVGEQMVADLVQHLGAKSKELEEDYAKLPSKHNPLTFDQVEEIWEREVHPRLRDFASMQSGTESPPENSRWYANWHVPSRG